MLVNGAVDDRGGCAVCYQFIKERRGDFFCVLGIGKSRFFRVRISIQPGEQLTFSNTHNCELWQVNVSIHKAGQDDFFIHVPELGARKF